MENPGLNTGKIFGCGKKENIWLCAAGTALFIKFLFVFVEQYLMLQQGLRCL
jgi:hypothetical protein